MYLNFSSFNMLYNFKNVFDFRYHEVNQYDAYWKIYNFLKVTSAIAIFDYYYKCFRIFSLIRVPLSKLFVYFYLIMKYLYLLLIPVIIFPRSNKVFQIIFDNFLLYNEFYQFYIESYCLYSCFYYLLIPYVYEVFPDNVKKYLKLMIFIACFGKLANIAGYAAMSTVYLYVTLNDVLIVEIISLLPMFLETFPLLIIISMLNDRPENEEPIEVSSSKSLEIPLMT